MPRAWMDVPDPAKLREAVEYTKAFVYPDCAPMPEVDPVMAEMALSLVCGMYNAVSMGGLRSMLDATLAWLDAHPGEWPGP